MSSSLIFAFVGLVVTLASVCYSAKHMVTAMVITRRQRVSFMFDMAAFAMFVLMSIEAVAIHIA